MEVELKEGVFDTYTRAEYDAIPAMRSSMAVDIMQTCPLKAKYDSENNKTSDAMDIGSAAHVIYLEPEKVESEIVIITADNWLTKDAREQRAQAYLNKKIPLLPKNWDLIFLMRDGFFKNKAVAEYTKNVLIEQTLIWKDPITGIWCKARPDIIGKDPAGNPFMANFKTQANIHPDKFAAVVNERGYHQQADWYLQGYKIITGEILDYVYLAQEKEAPYMAAPFRVGNQSMEAAFRLNRRALQLYADCLAKNEWHGYRAYNQMDRDTVITVDIPAWAMMRLEDRFEQERIA